MNAITKVDAPLPINYERAKQSLEQCRKIDECKEWADKARALASYARQADDDALFNLAERIRGRAVRRYGELLAEVEPSKGGRPKTRGGVPPSLTPRQSAAAAAKLSPDQAKQGLRVAAIPADEFEAAIEADPPPTVTELAERGKRQSTAHLKGRDPEDLPGSIEARSCLRKLADVAGRVSVKTAVRGALKEQRVEMREQARIIGPWLADLAKELEQ